MKLVYAYHCSAPVSGLGHLQEEHNRCRALWDELVQIDRAHEHSLLDAACIDAEIRNRAEAIRACEDRKERSALWREQRKAVAKWGKENKEVRDRINRDRLDAVKKARQECPAWWPNYNRVIQAYQTARAVCRQKGRRLRLYDDTRGDGVMAVQIQRTRSGLGASPGELQDGTVPMLQISDSGATMRVDAEGHLARFHVTLHRPLPQSCRIKSAQLIWANRIGRTEWKLCLTVALPAPEPLNIGVDAVPVMLVWERNGSLIVARAGNHVLALPDRLMSRLDRVREWAAWLDASRNNMREHADSKWQPILQEESVKTMLAMLLARAKKAPKQQLPHGIGEHGLETQRAYADAAALRGDVLEWRRGWAYVYRARLETWSKALRWRRELYRIWAQQLVRSCPHLDLDERDFSRIARDERGEPENNLRQMAAPHTLRAEIIHQARKIGARVVTASGQVLSPIQDDGSGAWARRKAAKAERSQEASETQQPVASQ